MSSFRTVTRCCIALSWTVVACTEVGVAPQGGGSRVVTQLVISPGQARLAAVGDTARLKAGLYDNGTLRSGTAVTWTSADPDVFTIDQSGLVTGRKALSVGRAIASALGYADTAYVVVADPDASLCLGYSAPVALAVGQAVTVSASDGACITSAGGGDEYVVVPWYGALDSSTVPLEVTGNGLAAVAPSPSRSPLTSRFSSARQAWSTRPSASLSRNVDFDRGLRALGRRELMPLAAKGRAKFMSRASAPATATTIPTYLSVGDLVDLNTNTDPCTELTIRTGRVVATSARAIVVADTGNPAGGFSDADYARIATTYDTLVAAVEDAAFGTPTDIDANGKVVIFFTRSVNELTAPGSSTFVAGYFHPRDLLPQTYGGQLFCPSSNEREMFYMPVPDPNGVVNGNKWTLGFVDSLTIRTLAHENQHLVNFGRRVYVNEAFTDEEPWLNEGLSDVAEELVFYRATGLAPRQNIGGEHFGTQPFDALFGMYMAPNFARLAMLLQDPQSHSPYSSLADSATTGAAWSFLRYAADHRGSSDGDVWLRLVNSQVSGFDNLFDVFGQDVPQMLSAWSVSLYTDDQTAGVDAAYTQPSWNFRTAYPALPTSPQPSPLPTGVLADGVAQSLTLSNGSSAFFRFAIGAPEAVIRLTSGGWAAPGVVQATIVRTK